MKQSSHKFVKNNLCKQLAKSGTIVKIYVSSVFIISHEPPAPSISEAEFDEILQRNKTVSSSAISRAVQDASAGKNINYKCYLLCILSNNVRLHNIQLYAF